MAPILLCDSNPQNSVGLLKVCVFASRVSPLAAGEAIKDKGGARHPAFPLQTIAFLERF